MESVKKYEEEGSYREEKEAKSGPMAYGKGYKCPADLNIRRKQKTWWAHRHEDLQVMESPPKKARTGLSPSSSLGTVGSPQFFPETVNYGD